MPQAEQVCRDALAVFRESGDLSGVAGALRAMAALRIARGQIETGLRLGGAAVALEDEVGGRVPAGLRPFRDPRDLAAGMLQPDAIAETWEAGQSLSVEEAVALMLEEPATEMHS